MTEGVWNYNKTSIDTGSSPVTGRFKTNSGAYRNATQIAIHAITIRGINESNVLRTQLVGDKIQCQDSINSSAWCRYVLQSAPIDHGTWFQLNVALEADGNVASGDNQEIIFNFTPTNAPSNVTPTMAGAATAGTAIAWSRGDHVHPSDTSRVPFAGGTMSGVLNLKGVTDASNATAGQIGEYLTVQRLSTAAIALTNNTDVVVTTLNLTAGDWDVWGSVGFTISNATNVILKTWLNAGGTVAPPIDQIGGNAQMPVPDKTTAQAILAVTPMRVSSASGITIALGSTSSFGGTITGWGKIIARRRR